MSVAIQQADGDYAAIVVSGANLELDEAHIAASGEAIRDSRVLVLQNEVDAASDRAAATIARAAGVTVILNAAPARPMGRLAGLVDVLVVNAIEAEMLGAGPVDDLAAALEAADALRTQAPKIVVTAGAAGVAAVSVPTAGQSRPTMSSVPRPTAPATSSWAHSRPAWRRTSRWRTPCATPTCRSAPRGLVRGRRGRTWPCRRPPPARSGVASLEGHGRIRSGRLGGDSGCSCPLDRQRSASQSVSSSGPVSPISLTVPAITQIRWKTPP